MTGFLIAGVALVLITGLALIWPAIRSTRSRPAIDAELAVYRDQIDEVERDLARGVIDKTASIAARNEIERRMLKTSRFWQHHGEEALQTSGSGRIAAVLIGAFMVPVATAALYVVLGNPGQPDMPFASREAPVNEFPPEVVAMVANLEARLEEEPDDLEGWLRLARSKQVMNRHAEAIEALRKASALAPDDLEIQSQLGESLVNAAQGIVTPEAAAIFENLQAQAPFEPRSGYFLGLAELQSGNGNAAYDRWWNLLANTPIDAPWRETLLAAINETAQHMDMNVAGIADQAAPPMADRNGGATANRSMPPLDDIDPETMARFDSMSQEERLAQIEGMVTRLKTRLESEGGEPAEWQRLGRALSVLDDIEASRVAFAKAVELAPHDPVLKRDYAVSLMGGVHDPTGLPLVGEEAHQQFVELAALTPTDGEIHWYLGVHALQKGDRDAALQAWQTALDLVPDNHPDRATLQQFVDELQ